MTDIKIDPHVDLNPRYTTHKDLDQYNVRFRVNRLIDENRVLGKYLNIALIYLPAF